ncbi:PREDICTED: solute carrier family 15 member 2-like [Nicrophorus vespilloides]|uniref:Solute carrier family 15 member 2-like n=2 Tax=Nicrophorus vespilloides TaxID=110193 RepID=A0ABM1N203_NICVS|nr:PREDICTED: solute carrier family 15 member 2-like [Nicrophorus vespilloides]
MMRRIPPQQSAGYLGLADIERKKSALYISIICIIGTEFWERFSFCGLRTILSLYLRNELLLAENSATIVYHVFIMMCYLIPIFGAICADSFLGRYRTILYFSLIYILGNIFMIFAAIPTIEMSPILATILGLGFIAIGTGGTKPCVAAFGGDQFKLPIQQDKLQQFFSLFYFAINLGGFVGMILTPILRKAVTCFGDDTCYALGFGFPAVLMLLSLLLFILGKPWYRMKSPKGNVMLQFVNCTAYALAQKVGGVKRENTSHWLDYAKGKFNTKLIHDMKVVYAVLCLYAPLPLFWSLFDQQGSRWTFQASRMNGFIWGLQIVPDQMQVINPALVLFLIPFFDKFLYPLLSRRNCLDNHLHRMAVGGLIAGLAFICAGFLELILERNYPKMPGNNRASVNFVNTLPCDVDVKNPFNGFLHLNSTERYRFEDIPAHNNSQYNITVYVPTECGFLKSPEGPHEVPLIAIEHQIDSVILAVDKNYQIVNYLIDPIEFRRSLSGKPRMRIVLLKMSDDLFNITITLQNTQTLTDIYYFPDTNNVVMVSGYLELPPDGYIFSIQSNVVITVPVSDKVLQLALGGIYTLVLVERGRIIEFAKLYTMSPPNDVNIMWLIPQYFLISVAEIMFGIAGLEFSFTQAPKSMKTVTIAAWYLSVAFGNFMVILITQLNIFQSQAYEFFLFAILIVGDMMIFMQMASRYNYVELEADSSVFILNTERTPLMRAFTNDEYDYD